MKNLFTKMILFVFISSILFTLISCSGGSKDTNPSRFQEFRTGSEGVRMEFVQNSPPSRIFDDQDLNVNVKISNVGAEALTGADRVYISGFDPSIVTGLSTFGESIPQLEGKTQYNLQGTFGFVPFKAVPRNLRSKNLDKYDFRLIASACYSYRTLAQNNVCIDPDPYNPSAKQKACEVDQYQSVSTGSQGAPVSVSSINVESSPARTRFIITVQNVGIGYPYRWGIEYLTKCSPFDSHGLEFNEVNAVKLEKVEIAGVNIAPTCKPLDQGHIQLYNNRATITCELATQRGQASFISPILVELRYGYYQKIEKLVQVVAVE